MSAVPLPSTRPAVAPCTRQVLRRTVLGLGVAGALVGVARAAPDPLAGDRL